MSGRVAVVIPCYNAADWLAETLDSVLVQTAPPAEIVVVDDGSTDGSPEIAEGKQGVRCVRQDNAGPAAARNRGIAETRAPLVAFLDADDCFVPEKLARQVDHLERAGAGVVLSCTDAWVVRDGVRGGRKNRARAVPEQLTFARLLQENPIICSSTLVRRAALEQVGRFDEDRVLVATEDYDLWLRLASVGDLAYLDEPLVEYRMTPGQLSDDVRFLGGIERIMEKVLAARGGEPGIAAGVRARRAGVRLDAAYHLARSGQGREARRWLREAATLGGARGRILKTWIRSCFGSSA